MLTSGLRDYAAADSSCYRACATKTAPPPFLALATAVEGLADLSDLFMATDLGAAPELQLYLRVANGLLSAATRQPTALVLHDLHWADLGTWELVRHIVARAAHHGAGRPARLLVVVTCRSDELTPRMQTIVERLLTEVISRPLLIGGLDEPALHALLLEVGGARPSENFVQWVLDVTGGRPLDAINLVERLATRNLLEARDGRLTTRVPTERVVLTSNPTEAWQMRIDKLSRENRERLQWVALLGEGALMEELTAVLGVDERTIDSFLEDTAHAGILVEEADHIRFTHGQLRRAVLASLSERTVLAREGEIARRLVVHYGQDAALHAIRIFPHLRRAPHGEPFEGWLRDLAKQAAEQAAAVASWGTAATYYEDSLRVSGPQTSVNERAWLRLRTARAYVHNHAVAAARPHLLAAIELARTARDPRAWGEALFWLTNVEIFEQRNDSNFDWDQVTQFLESAGDEATDERALVLANVAQYHFGRFEVTAGIPAIRQARELASNSPRPLVRHFVAIVDGLNHLGALELDSAKSCFAEAVTLSPDHEDPWLAVQVALGLLPLQILAGELDVAGPAAAEAEISSLHTHEWNLHGLALACQGAVALARGQAREAARWASAALQSYRRSDYFYTAAIGFPTLAGALGYLGDLEGARRALADLRAVVGSLAVRYEAFLEVLCGEPQRARQLLTEEPLLPLPSTASLFSLNQAVAAIEVGDRLDDLNLVESGYVHLLDAYARGVRFSLEWSVCIPRVLAQAALRLADPPACNRWLVAGRDAARRAASPLELARLRTVHGRLLAADDHDEGLRQLEHALGFFESADLLPFAVNVRRLAPHRALSRRRNVVVVYMDLCESTTLIERGGDQLYFHLRREYHEIVQRWLDFTGGIRFHASGDEVGGRFDNVNRALKFTFGLREDLDQTNRAHPQLPLAARVTIAMGDVYEDDGILSGRTVIRAARMLGVAQSAQVIVDEDVKSAADQTIADFVRLGSHTLKGFATREVLYRAEQAGTEFL